MKILLDVAGNILQGQGFIRQTENMALKINMGEENAYFIYYFVLVSSIYWLCEENCQNQNFICFCCVYDDKQHRWCFSRVFMVILLVHNKGCFCWCVFRLLTSCVTVSIKAVSVSDQAIQAQTIFTCALQVCLNVEDHVPTLIWKVFSLSLTFLGANSSPASLIILLFSFMDVQAMVQLIFHSYSSLFFTNGQLS